VTPPGEPVVTVYRPMELMGLIGNIDDGEMPTVMPVPAGVEMATACRLVSHWIRHGLLIGQGGVLLLPEELWNLPPHTVSSPTASTTPILDP